LILIIYFSQIKSSIKFNLEKEWKKYGMKILFLVDFCGTPDVLKLQLFCEGFWWLKVGGILRNIFNFLFGIINRISEAN
jgi:hypothetical protein